MDEKELENIANVILSDLANRNITFEETIKTLRIADGKIRTVKAAIFEKVERASIKKALEEADVYSSSTGISEKMTGEEFNRLILKYSESRQRSTL